MFSVVNLQELTPVGRKMDRTPIKLTHYSQISPLDFTFWQRRLQFRNAGIRHLRVLQK